ncbi:MAG: ATP-binding cassette domain-containing protein, partial [Mailhella sp.]|nr:ATP-binding cassette domain-containing protein [Mailhella sp.]
MSQIFEIRELRKEYGGLLALDLPELDVASGDLVSLVGRNGSGKSTLLRMLAFLEKPSSGLLNYFGGPEPRREVTLLLQNPYLLKCSVFDNVTLGLSLRGDRENLPARYAEAMRAAGFADPQAMASRYSSQLSGGE